MLHANYFPQTNHGTSWRMDNKVLLEKGDEPLLFLGILESTRFCIVSNPYCVLIAWNSSDLSVTFHPEDQKKEKYPSKSKPCSLTVCEDVLVYAESSGSLTFAHLISRISIEVSSQEHGMNCIDNICFDSLHADGKGKVVLFNYKDRLAVTCGFNLQSLISLQLSIIKVCKFNVEATEKVLLVTILDDIFVIVTEEMIYREKRLARF